MVDCGASSCTRGKELSSMFHLSLFPVTCAKAHGQCSNGDPCSFSHDTMASGNSGAGQRRRGGSSSPASHSKAKQKDGEKVNKEEISDKRSQRLYPDTEIVKTCRVSLGIFPFRITNLKKDVFTATNAISDMLRQKESPAKSQRRVVRKDQLRY